MDSLHCLPSGTELGDSGVRRDLYYSVLSGDGSPQCRTHDFLLSESPGAPPHMLAPELSPWRLP
jgi:hypothetical protein